MLCLTRHAGESVIITTPDGMRIIVHVVEVQRHRGEVRLGFDAPADVTVNRHEVQQRMDREGQLRGPHARPPSESA